MGEHTQIANTNTKAPAAAVENSIQEVPSFYLQMQEDTEVPSPDADTGSSDTGVPGLFPPSSFYFPPGRSSIFGNEFNLGNVESQIDWFAMSQPYLTRSIARQQQGDAEAIKLRWLDTFSLAQSLGFGLNRATWISNTLTPLAIDSALKGDFPTAFELSNQELGLSPTMVNAPAIHFKLQVGARNDSFEREADSVAEKVMRTEETFLQKKCASCEQEEKVQRQSEEEEELQMKPLVQRKISSEKSNITTPWIDQQINSKRGSGQTLPDKTRSFMESGIGANFQNVKVHTDSTSVQMNRELGARAFTVGNDVFFNSGQYSPESAEGKRLLAHELTHTVQQGSSASISPKPESVQKKCEDCEEDEKKSEIQPSLQRELIQRSDESHDLTSTQLQGDSLLEQTYDGFEVIKPPMKGPAVGRIQNALIELGFELNQFGVDEDYGSETATEVRKYQAQAGMSPAERDGKVNSVTIGLMDRDLRQGVVGGDTDSTSEDNESGKYFKSAEEPLMTFYTQGRWELDAEERAKLTEAVATHGDKAWTLRGFASDEGSDSANEALANERARQLADTLILEFGFENIIIFDDDAWEVGQGNINYAYFRSVKIVPEGMENEDFDQTCGEGQAKTGPCSSIDPERETLFTTAHTRALELVDAAIAAFPMEGDKITVFDELFDINNGDETLRQSRENLVRARLVEMRTHIANMINPDMHQCGTLCHPICQAGSPAFNRDKELTDPHTGEDVENAEGVMTICPAFKTFNEPELPIILVHEGHHGTPGFVSRDEAYNPTRAIVILDFDRAMSNAGTFHVFVSQLSGIDFSGSSIGPTFEDQFDPDDGFTEDERSKANEGVAWPHQWIIRSGHIVSAMYSYMNDIRQGKDSYSNPEKEGLKGIIEDIAFDFPITRPNGQPREADLIMLAAIADRLSRMEAAFENAPLEFSKSGSDGSSWEAGPGREVRLSDLYFSSPLDQRLNIILQELVHATPDISVELEPAYVRMVHTIREGLGLGPS